MKVVKNFPTEAVERIGNAARQAFTKLQAEIIRFDDVAEADRLPIDMQIDDDSPWTEDRTVTFASRMEGAMTYSFLVWIIRLIVRLNYSHICWMKHPTRGYGLVIFPKGDSWITIRPQVQYLFGDGQRPERAATSTDFDDGE